MRAEVYLSSMLDFRGITSEYSLRNIHDAEERGLLYSVIPSRSYVLLNERRREVRGKSFMRSKSHITKMVCANEDGSHKLPMFYIGRS